MLLVPIVTSYLLMALINLLKCVYSRDVAKLRLAEAQCTWMWR
jgi:hypothetical protein